MPVEPLITLHDRLWQILEFGWHTPPQVRVGNRLKLGTEAGWMKDFMHGAPADFPTVMIELGRRATHSAFEHQRTLDRDDPDFLLTPDPFWIERVVTVDITLKVDRTAFGGAAVQTGINHLQEAVQDDIMRSNTRLGLPELVIRFGPFDSTSRFTRKGEKPYPGRITVITFPVVIQEDGRQSLLL